LLFWIDSEGSTLRLQTLGSGDDGAIFPGASTASDSIPVDEWTHVAIRMEHTGTDTVIALFINGTEAGSGTDTSNNTAFEDTDVLETFGQATSDASYPGNVLEGEAFDLFQYDSALSDDWISEEYSQTADTTARWGEWAPVSVGQRSRDRTRTRTRTR
jgi:hypothetical protein